MYIISKDLMTEEPISGLLYGNFIELGYGLQVESMWGEMFFNRSFEKFYPYKNINVSWFDLWKDPKDHSKGYNTDWREYDWYHSGYEHNSWFAAPGYEGEFCIDEKSTFVINTSKDSSAELTQIRGGIHGEYCMRIENKGTHQRGGLGQQGKFLAKGESYKFSGYFKNVNNADNAIIEIFPEGDWDYPILSFKIENIGSDFTYKEIIFTSNYKGRVTFVLWTQSDSIMETDAFSMMPTDTIYGWRSEVVEEAKKLNTSVLRWPGGCFSSFYDWKNGIGSMNERKPEPSYFWGGLNYNDVGTAELAIFAKHIGAESMICLNMFHPKKEKYIEGHTFNEFVNIEKGAQHAADWVAYCNAPANHPMGKLRAEHGYEKPFNVMFWELDNEVMRWYDMIEYAEAVRVYSIAMKKVDPNIKIGMVTYWWNRGKYGKTKWRRDDEFTELMRKSLEIAGPHIDFFADRDHEIDDLNLKYKLDLIKEYNENHNNKIRYCNTEWLAHSTVSDEFNMTKDIGKYTQSYLFSKWEYAMNVFRCHMMWQRAGGDVLFVNFNNFANTHSQCVINTPKEGVFIAAAGKALGFISGSPAAWPLKIKDYTPLRMDEFQVQAAWNKKMDKLVLYIFNRTNENRRVEFDISGLKKSFRSATISKIYADSLHAMNTLEKHNEIKEDSLVENNIYVNNIYAVDVNKYSFTQITLE